MKPFTAGDRIRFVRAPDDPRVISATVHEAIDASDTTDGFLQGVPAHVEDNARKHMREEGIAYVYILDIDDGTGRRLCVEQMNDGSFRRFGTMTPLSSVELVPQTEKRRVM